MFLHPDNLQPTAQNTQCPICQSDSWRYLKKDGFWIRRCGNCHHQFLENQPQANHIEQVYGDNYFYGGGAGYPGYLTEAQLIRTHGQRYAKLLRPYMSPGRVLDVGAAAGFILQGLIDAGWEGTGVEPNERMANYGRKKLGLDIRTGSFEQLHADETYNLVSMVQVIPHFWDLHQALATAKQATEPGGYWLIETWNRDSRLAKFFGTNWHEYSPPSVLRWFSPTDLNLLAQQYGFELVSQGRPQKWISGCHIKSLAGHKLRTMGPFRPLRWFLQFIPDQLRLPYPSEDLFWALYRKVD